MSNSPGDGLLRWASEVGSAPWDALRQAAAHLCSSHQIRVRPSRLTDSLSALGHLDIDWERRVWSVARPTINVVPGLGLCTVLTGSRTYYLEDRYRQAAEDNLIFPMEFPQPIDRYAQRPLAPKLMLAKCTSLEVARELAQRFDANYVEDPATGLVAAMRGIEEPPTTQAAPPQHENASWFNPETYDWVEAPPTFPGGLYRQDLGERTTHLWYDEDRWCHVELPEGQFRAIKGLDRPVFRWRPAPDNAGQASRFEMPARLRLPTLAERALTVSLGKLPTTHDGWRRYRNIPITVAATLANKLGQALGDYE